jgi:hypothetical protein
VVTVAGRPGAQRQNPELEHVIGTISCQSGKMRPWVRADLPRPLLYAVIEHEQAHIDFFAREGIDCSTYHEWMREPRNQWRAETYAYCREARFSVEHGMYPHLDAAHADLALEMLGGLSWARARFVPLGHAMQAISEAC